MTERIYHYSSLGRCTLGVGDSGPAGAEHSSDLAGTLWKQSIRLKPHPRYIP
jgi:hypothetical protein